MFEFLKASVYALIIYPGIACILSLVLTRLCIGLLPRAGFVDMPDARRVHRKPTPRGLKFGTAVIRRSICLLYGSSENIVILLLLAVK